jgi:N-acetylneuraminic acid mutarotase
MLIRFFFLIIYLFFFMLVIPLTGPVFAEAVWNPTGNMNFAHGNLQMVKLMNGTIFAVGGPLPNGISGRSEIYDSKTGKWHETSTLTPARVAFVPVLLDNGKVLVAGGDTGSGNSALSETSLYDPANDSWEHVNGLNQYRNSAPTVKLKDGRILIISGVVGQGPMLTETAEIFDPATNLWSYTGSLNNSISDAMGGDVVLLDDGRVLKVGNGPGGSSKVAELFNPATNTWKLTGNLLVNRYNTKLIKLKNEKVLMIGGDQWGKTIADCEIFDPATEQWTETGALTYARDSAGAVVLPDGKVFVAGGSNIGTPIIQSEIFDPSNGTWTVGSPIMTGHVAGSLISLTDGDILLAGGYDEKGLSQATELYATQLHNSPPLINLLPDAAINEGSIYTANGSFSDPDLDTYSASVDYGDGSGIHALTLSAKNFVLEHQYKDDGVFSITVFVTDSHGASDQKLITVKVTNVAAKINTITVPTNAVLYNTNIQVTANFTDPGELDSHNAGWNWGDGSASNGNVTEKNGSGTVTNNHTYKSPGLYQVILIVTDKDGGQSISLMQEVAVYDPETKSVIGNYEFNSPTGALIEQPAFSGKAIFGLTAKYDKKGSIVPMGNGWATLDLQHKTSLFQFKADKYSWLITSGNKAMLKGTGKVNNIPGYTFLITVIDRRRIGNNDLVRFKLQNAAGTTVYDTQFGAPDSADPTIRVENGNITIF